MSKLGPVSEALLERIGEIFSRRGAEAYLGEAVTMSEHMCQAAALAAAEQAPEALIAAALLHDIGQFTSALGEYAVGDIRDNRHETAAGEILAGVFPPRVVEAVRLHVAAKRYLCAVDPAYHDRLSTASRGALRLQGGPMNAAEIAGFERSALPGDAVRLRLWDDAAKVAGLPVPTFDDYRPLLRRVIAAADPAP